MPEPNTDFVAFAAGWAHSLGVKADGSIVAWGANHSGQCDVPPPNADFVAVEAGGYHSIGLKADGSIVAWGTNGANQCNVPPPNAGFVTVAAGMHHNLGLREVWCGDGVVDTDEECDDGGESTTCDSNCTFAECGDGTLNTTAGEECDDGNTQPDDGCNATCQIEQEPIPTVSAWGMTALALSLLAGYKLYFRRRGALR